MGAGAYFLTWTTYGSWLPGDPRGSAAKGQNTPGTPYVAHDPSAIEAAARTIPCEAVNLGAPAREIVERTIREHCKWRGWPLHVINVRSNHVHVVLTSPITPERCMTQLKSWSTRRLREAGLIEPDARVWTRHGSTRYIWPHEDPEPVVRYVLYGQ